MFDPSESLRLGDIVGGKYRVLRRVGKGGMGTVFEAEHTLTLKRVAIKWLHPQTDKSSHCASQLLREAQAAARVRHPNVVDIYDVGREGDALFLVMELLEGEPLSHVLARGGLSIPSALALLLSAMRGVAAAHKVGVIHRDIKPDNIFLAHEEDAGASVPKILDFGISKVERRDGPNASVTTTGSIMGTPLYMSQEQLMNSKDVDARTDVYAFGVILYQALTGIPPYPAASMAELAVKIATTEPVALTQLRPELPIRLDLVVRKAMARAREDRFPSIAALIAELEPFASVDGFRDQMTEPQAPLPSVPSPADGFAASSVGRTMQSARSLLSTGYAVMRTSLASASRETILLTAVFVVASMILAEGFGTMPRLGSRSFGAPDVPERAIDSARPLVSTPKTVSLEPTLGPEQHTLDQGLGDGAAAEKTTVSAHKVEAAIHDRLSSRPVAVAKTPSMPQPRSTPRRQEQPKDQTQVDPSVEIETRDADFRAGKASRAEF